MNSLTEAQLAWIFGTLWAVAIFFAVLANCMEADLKARRTHKTPDTASGDTQKEYRNGA